MTAKAPVLEVTWRAHFDGIGHALLKGPGITRYVCNRRAIAERFAWPVKSRCRECVVLVDTSHG